MKFLIYGVNFAPELTGIGKYSSDMAQWLVEQGHSVRVVAAPPYYPHWRLQKDYRRHTYRREVWNRITIWRAPLWVPKFPGGLARILHLISFAITSFPIMLRQVFWRPDVVLTVAPAFVCAPTGWLTARLSGALAWLHLQDFELDVAFNMGLMKGRLLQRAFRMGERWMLRRFDTVSSISHRMVEKLIRKGVRPARVRFFPNWVDTGRIKPSSPVNGYRKQLGISPEAIVVMFSGSLGGKQGLMQIPAAATRLADRQDIAFVVCGEGIMARRLQEASMHLPNFHLLPLQPLDRLSELLGTADIHLLPQSPSASDLVLPSKLSGMLASGRPVIATCHHGTELHSVVSTCGTVVPPENSAALAEAILSLADDPSTRSDLGRCARAWAETHLERNAVLARTFASGMDQASADEAVDAGTEPTYRLGPM